MTAQRHDSTQLLAPFRWTVTRERAALAAAEDRESDEAIATSLGISRVTLRNWRRHPDFAARVAEHQEAQRAALLALGIAEKRNRLAAKNRRHAKLERVVAARAADSTMARVPGGETGLLVRSVKWVKRYNVLIRETTDYEANEIGEDEDPEHVAAREFLMPDGTQLVEEYAVDTGLLAEMDRLELSAAKEVGDLGAEVGDGGSIIIRQYIGIDVERV